MNVRSYEQAREAAAHAVFTKNAIAFDLEKGFPLKLHERYREAPKSPFKINLRPTAVGGNLSEDDFAVITRAMFLLADKNDLLRNGRLVAGIPNAGIPFIDSFMHQLADTHSLQRFDLIKEKVGSGRKITGIQPEHADLFTKQDTRCLVLDDVVTRAETKFEAATAIRNAGGNMEDLVVFIDRRLSFTMKLEQFGINLHSVWRLDAILHFGLSHGCVTQDQVTAAIQYPAVLKAALPTEVIL